MQARLHTTTMINKNLQRQKLLKMEPPSAAVTDLKKSPFFDPRLHPAAAPTRRAKREFKFVEPVRIASSSLFPMHLRLHLCLYL